MLMAADELGLSGLWFEGSKYYADRLPAGYLEQKTEILSVGKRWLDLYFGGQKPDFLPPLHPEGTAFQKSVWDILLEIPYGKTISYGEIAGHIALKQGISRMSAQGHIPSSAPWAW